MAIQARGHVRGKTGARAMYSSRDAGVQRCVRAPGLKRDKHGHYTALSRPYLTTNDLQGFRNYTCMNSELFNKKLCRVGSRGPRRGTKPHGS